MAQLRECVGVCRANVEREAVDAGGVRRADLFGPFILGLAVRETYLGARVSLVDECSDEVGLPCSAQRPFVLSTIDVNVGKLRRLVGAEHTWTWSLMVMMVMMFLPPLEDVPRESPHSSSHMRQERQGK